MASLDELTPAERACLLSKPEGELGIAIGKNMNQTNGKLIETVYRRLGLEAGHSVLEIGFGNGRTVPLLMALADSLTYVGVDIAETMVEEARSFNRPLIEAGRATFHLASAASLPCSDASFNRVLAVNVIYFWPDPLRVLAEIRRVLRPNGFSIIAGMDSVTAATRPFYRAEYGFRIHDADALIAFHRQAGFTNVDLEPYDEITTASDGMPHARHYHIVISRP